MESSLIITQIYHTMNIILIQILILIMTINRKIYIITIIK